MIAKSHAPIAIATRQKGKWHVDEDGRFCLFWPPTYRACYGLLWIVEGDEIVGPSFTELRRGTRFDVARQHETRPARALSGVVRAS